MSSFGWQPPSDAKRADNERYLLSAIHAAPLTVERELAYPDYVSWYDQGNLGACVGYSCSWQMSIYNNPTKYNGTWLYRQAQKDDGDPATDPSRDTGAHLWAGMDVLRKRGHCVNKTTSPVKAEGIESYYWCKTIDDIRTAIDLARVPVFGIYWFSEFMAPRTVGGEYWIGTRNNWGGVVGGHAIACIAASDRRQAVRLLNTWGDAYPPVWIGYRSVERLLSAQGECAVGMDIGAKPPEPEPGEDEVTVKIGGIKYKGVLERVE